MARTINAAATNAANTMLTITPTIKILLSSNFVAAHCLENVTDELVETVKIDIEKTVYNLTKQIAYKLKATSDAETDKEIQSACIIIDGEMCTHVISNIWRNVGGNTEKTYDKHQKREGGSHRGHASTSRHVIHVMRKSHVS
jgi:hypothetical protein